MDSAAAARQWVDELQEYFSRIVQTSGEVSEALEDISQGNEESSSGIEYISGRIQEMCEVNEKNACFVDEIAHETNRLHENSLQLQKITEIFILGKREELQEDSSSTESDPSLSNEERWKASPRARFQQEEMLRKPGIIDQADNLSVKEFKQGFEEF
jgi:methyl-accepting chemotaxis protein